MKIAFVSQPGHTILPAVGSLELWTGEVARRLAQRGHDVRVYGSRVGAVERAMSSGVEYRFIEHDADRRVARVVRKAWRLLPEDRAYFSSRLHPYIYWRRLADEIRASGADVVHIYNYSQALPVIRRRNPDATLILHMQCEWLTQLNRRLVSERLRGADFVVGCSRYITNRIAERFPEHAERCRTVYNGVEIPEPVGRPARSSDAEHTVQLLHVGRISPEKGLHVLVDAFNELVRKYPALRLTFVGEESLIPLDMAVALFDDSHVRGLRQFYDGSYLKRLTSALSEDARERVRFAGRLSHAETLAAYRGADVFVFPSIFEAFPIPPIEAMAAEIPVVATPAGGTIESVVDGETGLLVERDDAQALARAIEQLVVDPELRRRLGEAGRARAARLFSWGGVTDRFEALFSGRRDGDVDGVRLEGALQ